MIKKNNKISDKFSTSFFLKKSFRHVGKMSYLLKFLDLIENGYLILMYHSLSKSSYEYSYDFEKFKEQNKYLNKNFNIVKLSDMLIHNKKNRGLKLIITFDDGYRDNFNAFKWLKKHSIPATFFITTNFISNDDKENLGNNLRPMSWREIKKISSKDLFTIGSHTHTHKFLTDLNKNEVINELKESKQILEKKLNTKVNSISFPGGRYDSKIIRYTKKCGYDLGLTSELKINKKPLNYYNLGRFAIRKNYKIKL